jgi:hypothetical protein
VNTGRDLRLWPANAKVAHSSVADSVQGVWVTDGTTYRVTVPVSDLMNDAGRRERQLVMGETFRVLDMTDGFAFGFAERDGYVGYMRPAHLQPDRQATHLVVARASHLYSEPDLKSPERAALSFGSLLVVTDVIGAFARTDSGHFVPGIHLDLASVRQDDTAGLAALFLGTPYLWGGNSAYGLDCSGLVQMCHLACGISCPGDADLQEARFDPLPPGSPLGRGDLVFWQGHVALAEDSATLIHANAYQMAVTRESRDAAEARIALSSGPVTSIRRPRPPAG